MSTTYNCVHYDRDRMRSCIYGLAVGDALGVPYEFSVRGAHLNAPAWSVTAHTGSMQARGLTTHRWPCVHARASSGLDSSTQQTSLTGSVNGWSTVTTHATGAYSMSA